MPLSDILTILGSILGGQSIIEAIKWWRNRHLHDRRDTAQITAEENENSRRQIDWLEARITERDTKIDHLYSELRLEQAARLEEVHRRHEVELRLAEAEVKKCHRRGCTNRQPPSDY